ncbi:hypothetical protein D3C78_1753180 [compost metagenome]
MDAIFEKLRGDGLVALGHWLERVGVQGVVEAENCAVDAFPRVFLGGLGGNGYQHHANTETSLGQTIDQTCTDHTHTLTP